MNDFEIKQLIYQLQNKYDQKIAELEREIAELKNQLVKEPVKETHESGNALLSYYLNKYENEASEIKRQRLEGIVKEISDLNDDLENLQNKLENTKHLCFIVFGVGIALCCYSPILHRFGLIEAHYVDDCYKIAGAAVGFAIAWYLERTKLNFSTDNLSAKDKAIRFVIGLTTTAVLYIVPKMFFKGIAIWKMLRYFTVIFWIIYAYPYLFTKYKK